MQTLLWSYLSPAFDMSKFPDLSSSFFAVDAYQQLQILLTNLAHAARSAINPSILELGTHICTTVAELTTQQFDFMLT